MPSIVKALLYIAHDPNAGYRPANGPHLNYTYSITTPLSAHNQYEYDNYIDWTDMYNSQPSWSEINSIIHLADDWYDLYYAGQQVSGILTTLDEKQELITPGSAISDAPTDAPTNAPDDAPTNYGALAAILGSDANANNEKQNAIAANLNGVATKLNQTATKLNTLISNLESQGIQSA